MVSYGFWNWCSVCIAMMLFMKLRYCATSHRRLIESEALNLCVCVCACVCVCVCACVCLGLGL